MNYSEKVRPDDDVYTIQEFREMCQVGGFVDDDGVGHPAVGGRFNQNVAISPSNIAAIPPEATHVVWFNK